VKALLNFSGLNQSEHGVTMVEVAITVLLFVGLLLGLLWTGLAIKGRSNLTHSMGDGMRFGVTRRIYNQSPVSDLNQWHAGGAPSDRVKELFCFNNKGQGACDTSEFESAIAKIKGSAFGSYGTSAIPVSYFMAIASIHQYMRAREGRSTLRYPCVNEPGCLQCTLLNPLAMGQTSPAPDDSFTGNTGPYASLIGVRCSYNLDYGMLSEAMQLLQTSIGPQRKDPKAATGPKIVTRTFFVNHGSD
jgi:hypothetical protein